MPFINSKVTVKMSEEKKDAVKAKLGEAVTLIPGKSETWLMVGFEDDYNLYFQGNRNEESAFVEVSLYGSAPASVYEDLTEKICGIFESELAIPKKRIYVKYQEVAHWGWNGGNL